MDEERVKNLEERVLSLEKLLNVSPYPKKQTTFTTSSATVTLYTQRQPSGDWLAWLDGGVSVRGQHEGEVLQRLAEAVQ